MKLRLFFLIILLSSLVCSQSYPYWFIYPSKIDCKDISVGYAASGYYSDSTSVAAFDNGCENYAKNKLIFIRGGQGFWSTEIGSIWMGSDISLSYDTLVSIGAKDYLKQIAFYKEGRFVAVLLSNSTCSPPNNSINLSNKPKPQWIENLPQSKNLLHAVGVSEGYYYESSSWLKAEDNARIELGKLLLTKISAFSRQTNTGGEIVKEENISANLSNCRISERWVDVDSNLYYVLMEMQY